MTNEQVANWSVWSVAVKVTTKAPGVVGVKLNELLTGLPLAGSGGVMVAPGGRPTTLRVTTSPMSGSDAWILNVKSCPTLMVKVVPHAGVGGWSNTGAFPIDCTS